MFLSAVQPSVISLFSSTGDQPLALFSNANDPALPADSFICLLNDTTSLPHPGPPCTLIPPPNVTTVEDSDDDESSCKGYTLANSVLHIQSPTLHTTFIRCPPSPSTRTSSHAQDLCIKHPWVHFQVRHLGRECAFEFGIVDKSGREGIIRCSTFQVGLSVSVIKPLSQTCNQVHEVQVIAPSSFWFYFSQSVSQIR